MIIVLKQHAPAEQVDSFCHELEDMGYQINDSVGSDTHILGLIGDTKSLAESWVLANPVVETCRRVTEPGGGTRPAAGRSRTRKPTASSTRTTPSWTWAGTRSAAGTLP